MNKKYIYLKKEHKIFALKNGFSWSFLIFDVIALLMRGQFYMFMIVVLLNYLFAKLELPDIIQTHQVNPLIYIYFLIKIFIAYNLNYWRYNYLIKQGYREIENPMSEFGFEAKEEDK